ncbi:MAG TPA: hypothetical protein VFD76_12560 [Gemmatimonadales bacterium]|nr:hypothetical protein [Gemmatimonadales bacterium]
MSVAVTSAAGKRPVVVLRGVDVPAEQVARAGFAALTFDPPGADELRAVLDALARGTLGPAAAACTLVERAPDGALAISRIAAGAPGPPVPEGTARDARDLIQWLAKHIT